MGWFSTLIAGGVDKLVTSVGDAIDKVVTSDEEKLVLRNELVQIEVAAKLRAQEMELQADARVEEEVSKRWTADAAGDDPWAKKVRPFALVFLLGVVTLFALFDGNLLEFSVRPAYIELFESLLLLVFAAYFGGRTMEKVMGRKRQGNPTTLLNNNHSGATVGPKSVGRSTPVSAER